MVPAFVVFADGVDTTKARSQVALGLCAAGAAAIVRTILISCLNLVLILQVFEVAIPGLPKL